MRGQREKKRCGKPFPQMENGANLRMIEVQLPIWRTAGNRLKPSLVVTRIGTTQDTKTGRDFSCLPTTPLCAQKGFVH